MLFPIRSKFTQRLRIVFIAYCGPLQWESKLTRGPVRADDGTLTADTGLTRAERAAHDDRGSDLSILADIRSVGSRISRPNNPGKNKFVFLTSSFCPCVGMGSRPTSPVLIFGSALSQHGDTMTWFPPFKRFARAAVRRMPGREI